MLLKIFNSKIILLLLAVLSAYVDSDTSISDLKVAKYLKNCGFLTSVKITKCVVKSSSIQKEIKKISRRKSEDLTKLRTSCKETTDCIKQLNCKPAEDDNKDVLDYCWRATFQEYFNECQQKLIELKKTKEGECLSDYKDEKNRKSGKELCLWLSKSRDCMRTHVKNQCGLEKYKDWERMARELYESNECLKMTGVKFE